MAPSTILSDAKIAEIAVAAGFPDTEVPTAVAVALAESGGRVGAVNHNTNGTADHGLFQINDVNLTLVGSTGPILESNPQINANAAHTIWQASGWGAWSTHNNGAYLAYLPRGKKALTDARHGTIGSQVGSAASDVASAVTSPITDVAKALSFIFSLQFLYILGGGALLIVALVLLTRSLGGGGGHGGGAKVIPIPL